jgi:hypothetical protein
MGDVVWVKFSEFAIGKTKLSKALKSVKIRILERAGSKRHTIHSVGVT